MLPCPGTEKREQGCCRNSQAGCLRYQIARLSCQIAPRRDNRAMSSFEAQSRLRSNVLAEAARLRLALSAPALLLAGVLTSCSVKIPTGAPPEFSAGISYTNYVVPEVPW